MPFRIPESTFKTSMIKESPKEFRINWHTRIADIDQGLWDSLALPLETPFLEWEWLHCMEVSGSISETTGWLPNHLTVWSGNQLVGAAPLYVKLHSEGEFVYDYAWADVATRLGIPYYPKMVGMSPVTPATGYRFLLSPEVNDQEITSVMVRAIDKFCSQNRLSGCSFLFVDPDWRFILENIGYLSWTHQSFIWRNLKFGTFDDYLSIFNANQRKNIRREKMAMKKQNLVLKTYYGDEIPDEFFHIMYQLYIRTNEKFGIWGCQYLTSDFFEGIAEKYKHRILFVCAQEKIENNKPVAMSFLVTKGEHLYGRYWGSFKKYDSLHFNTCYYLPIEWAVANGIREFNPGAGGGHKIRRGFICVPSYSLHRYYHPRLRFIMLRNINEINRLENEEIETVNQKLPFSEDKREKIKEITGIRSELAFCQRKYKK